MENRSHRHRSRGFTLLEMVTVMGIVGILMAIAIPSFKYVTSANRVAAEGNGLLGDLQYARAEAIKEGQSVSVCVTQDNVNCATISSSSNTWNTGWLIFSDVNGDGAINGADIRLRKSPAFSGTDTFSASNSVKAITFNREGFAAGLTGAQVFTLHTATTNNQWTRCLTLSTVGMMAVTRYDGSTCL
jgi:type IV fimbrial biogenesis protein FimT